MVHVLNSLFARNLALCIRRQLVLRRALILNSKCKHDEAEYDGCYSPSHESAIRDLILTILKREDGGLGVISLDKSTSHG